MHFIYFEIKNQIFAESVKYYTKWSWEYDEEYLMLNRKTIMSIFLLHTVEKFWSIFYNMLLVKQFTVFSYNTFA